MQNMQDIVMLVYAALDFNLARKNKMLDNLLL
jgi:hypothetical protein